MNAAKKKAGFLQTFLEYCEEIIIALILALIMRTYVVQAFKIPTGSMEPTLHGDYKKGDKILVNKFMYIFTEPKRGDIVVFTTKGIKGIGGTKDYIKRLVGEPGDTVVIQDYTLYINGEKTDDPVLSNITYYEPPPGRGYGSKEHPAQVPEDALFMLGDNSANSRDSRFWGYAPKRNVKGKAAVIWMPFNRIRILK